MAEQDSERKGDTAFELLAEGVQRQLYRMKWTQLRPIQADTIRAYLQGTNHILITAETASGKTEAAFLPVLSAINCEPLGSVRALYVGPLKALINDQFGRVEELCTHLDVPVHRWHGDVPAARKEALVREPGGVLLITPESLESILINRTANLIRLFGGLRTVVIDEVHSFLNNERGLHLSSLLSRVKRYGADRPVSFRTIGLSATVGVNEPLAKRYLSPDDPGKVTVISGDDEEKEIQFKVHAYMLGETTDGEQPPPESEHSGESEDADDVRLMRVVASDLVKHCQSRANLIFANARSDIEIYADLANENCRGCGLREAFLVHHGSLSREIREDTEGEMKSGRPMTTVCSSTLEMGVDIGSVSMVGQIGAPWSVASLQQRMGRSGRRANEPRRLRVYIPCKELHERGDPMSELRIELLQAIAVCELMLKKQLEPLRPSALDLSTLTHQTISNIAEIGAVSASDLYRRLCIEGPFRSVPTALFGRIVRELGGKDIVEQGPDGLLILGIEGERVRGRHDFYAAFAGRTEFAVIASDQVLGTLPIDGLPKLGDHLVFAARRWQVTDVDEAKLALYVTPARRRKRPVFVGSCGDVHAIVLEAMRLILADNRSLIYLDRTASMLLAESRRIAAEHHLAVRRIIPLDAQRCLWLTWTGTSSQRTLTALLASLGVESEDRRVAIACNTSAAHLGDLLRSSQSKPLDLKRLAEHVVPKQYRKYDPFFSDALLDESIATDRLDLASATVAIQEAVMGSSGAITDKT